MTKSDCGKFWNNNPNVNTQLCRLTFKNHLMRCAYSELFCWNSRLVASDCIGDCVCMYLLFSVSMRYKLRLCCDVGIGEDIQRCITNTLTIRHIAVFKRQSLWVTHLCVEQPTEQRENLTNVFFSQLFACIVGNDERSGRLSGMRMEFINHFLERCAHCNVYNKIKKINLNECVLLLV